MVRGGGTLTGPRWRTRRRGWTSWRWAVAVPLIVVTTVLILGSPVTSATYTIRVTPPYAGVAPILATTINTVGCSSQGHFGSPMKVNSTAGSVRLIETASSRNCTGGFEFAVTFATAGFEGSDFAVPASGLYGVTYHWSFSYNVSLHAAGTGAAATAEASVFAVGVVVDVTNGSILTGTGGDSFVLFHALHSGDWSQVVRALPVTLENGVNLVTGHVYEFYTFLECDVTAEETGSGSAHGSLDMGVDGNRANLVSMTLSG